MNIIEKKHLLESIIDDYDLQNIDIKHKKGAWSQGLVEVMNGMGLERLSDISVTDFERETFLIADASSSEGVSLIGLAMQRSLETDRYELTALTYLLSQSKKYATTPITERSKFFKTYLNQAQKSSFLSYCKFVIGSSGHHDKWFWKNVSGI
ncbi:hypothetical protein BCF46_0941 [Litoreibacter meonggei]|uniref:Uncharacterized protein n=1 Tax=Litoreibacter meonggei TaxID=1049199 RepID=A0A497X614_9RHOB|nr:hypothetical protein [Litoreibacter meonggei]RLJ60736.1 hypothetical protein BCF46_0941 [Litoreibacter meonggei]